MAIRATLEQREVLEHVYQTEGWQWPIKPNRIEQLVHQVGLDFPFIRNWFKRRRDSDRGRARSAGQQQQIPAADAPIVRATMEQREVLERVYQTEGWQWPIKPNRIEQLVHQVGLDFPFIRNWFKRRRDSDRGRAWSAGQQQQIPAADAPIVGSIEGRQPPQLQNLGQPQQQQQNDEDPVFTYDDLFSNDQGSIEGQLPPQLQNLGQAQQQEAQQQQQNDEDPGLTMDDFLLSDDHHMTSNPDTICSSESRGFNDQEMLNLKRLGHAMVKDLFHTISPDEDLWSSGALGVYATNYKLTQNREVAVGAITFNVAQSPKLVLKILGDEHIRHEWDFIGGFRHVHPIKCYVTGMDSKISISLINDPYDTVLTQEVTVSEARSLVMWSFVPRGISYQVSLGQELPPDSSSLLSIVSGFSITSAANNTSGSVITLVLRKLVDGNQQSQQPFTNAVNQTVARVREALQKQRPASLSPDVM